MLEFPKESAIYKGDVIMEKATIHFSLLESPRQVELVFKLEFLAVSQNYNDLYILM